MSTPSEVPADRADPFGAGALRRAVLDAWAASPDRFREDANAEEDAAFGAYRDRAVVELAQNAADAAVRAGAPGRLVLRLEGPRLLALNTGAPLDAEGVRALSSLRASAKRAGAGSVGRFGVGAASVLAVGDDVTWVSRAGGVRFSAGLARAAVARAVEQGAETGLGSAVAARGGAVPVLRLPFAVSAVEVPEDVRSLLEAEGCDTAAVVVLRDRGAVEEVAAALEAVDDTLLLALPALTEVHVQLPGAPPRVLRDVARRWHLLRRRGAYEPDELDGLGVEERERAARTGWSVAWALPREPRPLPGVLLAPTPTDEPLDAPAVLVADLPLDAGRRRVPDGPAARRALREAGAAFAALLEERALAGEDVLGAVPVGLAAGWVDAAVREAAVQALAAARVLQPVGEDDGPLRAGRAQALDDGPLADDPTALAALAPLVGGLVAAPRRARAALEVLGVRRVGLAEVAEVLPADPTAWCAAAAALAPAALDPAAREQLAVLRVPLADGRTAASPRGVLLPTGGDPAALEDLADAGLRLAHPLVAAEPAAVRLLTAVGAQPAGPRDLLAAPEVAELVLDLDDDDERVPHLLALVAEAVRGGGLAAGDLPALAELPLRAATGEVLPAAGLVLPGSPAAALLDPDEVAPVHPDLLERWGESVLAAVGVAGALAAVPLGDVDPHDPPTELLDVAGGQTWLQEVLERAGDGAVASGVAVVRDLDLLREGAQGPLLEHLAAVPALRSAVLDPVRVVRPDGTALDVAPPSAGWLRAELGLVGCAAPGCAEGLAAVLPAAPAWAGSADPALGRALGLVAAAGDLDADGWQRVLDGAADLVPPVPLDAAAVLPLWRALAQAATADPALAASLAPPSHVLALDAGAVVVVVPAERAAVVDDPCWAQRTDLGARLVAGADLAAALADVLEIPLSSELAPGRVDPVGLTTTSAVPPQVRSALPGCPPRWTEHDALTVDGQEVAWWVTGRGEHADVRASTADGLARGLALAAGRWHARALVAELLAEPDRAGAALLEDAAGARR